MELGDVGNDGVSLHEWEESQEEEVDGVGWGGSHLHFSSSDPQGKKEAVCYTRPGSSEVTLGLLLIAKRETFQDTWGGKKDSLIKSRKL